MKTDEVPRLMPAGQENDILLWQPEPDKAVLDYQLDIMDRMEDLLIPVRPAQTSESSFLLYMTKGMKNLEQLLLDSHPDRTEIFLLTAKTARALMICEDQLLDSRQIVLDPARIYFENTTAANARFSEPRYIYLPAEKNPLENPAADDPGQMAGFISLLLELAGKNKTLPDDEVSALRQLALGKPQDAAVWAEEKLLNPGLRKRHETKSLRFRKSPDAHLSNLPEPPLNPSETAVRRHLSPAAVLTADLILLFCMNVTLGIALKGGGLPFYFITGFGLFLLIVSDVLLLSEQKKKGSVQDTRFEQEKRQKEISQAKLEEETKSLHSSQRAASGTQKPEKLSLAFLYASDGRPERTAELLEGRKKNRAAAVMLNREFYVGRDRERCDFCPDTSGLSSIHARITRQDGTYLLTDLASDGGTWLNDIKLHYYEDYVLFSGARIRFGDSNYVFMIEEDKSAKGE